MAKLYNALKKQYEEEGYMPFVCIIKWPPDQRLVVADKYSHVFARHEDNDKGLVGLHTWNLMGKDTMIAIGWTNSPIVLQKFCASITIGTCITMDVCFAIDHFGLTEALGQLEHRFPEIPGAKAGKSESKTTKRAG